MILRARNLSRQLYQPRNACVRSNIGNLYRVVRENGNENEGADMSWTLFSFLPRHVPGVVNFQCIRSTIGYKSYLLYFCRQSRRDSWIISETLLSTWLDGVIYGAWDTIQIANACERIVHNREPLAPDGCLTFVFYYFVRSLNTTASIFVFCMLPGEIFLQCRWNIVQFVELSLRLLYTLNKARISITSCHYYHSCYQPKCFSLFLISILLLLTKRQLPALCHSC